VPLLVGSLAALVALVAATLTQVHWQFALTRGGIAFVVGWVLGTIWQAVFAQIKPLTESVESKGKNE
jgi:uncharacterized membrane protein YGL010W